MIQSKNIKYSFEVGSENDIDVHYLLTFDNVLYKLVNDDTVVPVNKRHFKKLYGITFTNLMKLLKKDYFVRITGGTLFADVLEDDDEAFGFYFENDHEQLVKDGVWGKSFKVLS